MRETRSKKSPSAASSSERRNWGNIFNLLVQMVRSQQNQLQSLSTQHKFVEDRLRMQHEAWASDIRLHNDQISQVDITKILLSFRVSVSQAKKEKEKRKNFFFLFGRKKINFVRNCRVGEGDFEVWGEETVVGGGASGFGAGFQAPRGFDYEMDFGSVSFLFSWLGSLISHINFFFFFFWGKLKKKVTLSPLFFVLDPEFDDLLINFEPSQAT